MLVLLGPVRGLVGVFDEARILEQAHVAGVFADGAPKPMVIGIAISALVAFAIARFTLPAENSRLVAAAD